MTIHKLRHDGPTITLAPMTADAAQHLGEAFAAIDPWASYPYPASGIIRYFAASEPGAPRYIIMRDGAMAGAIGIRENWMRGPYLQFLGVLPPYQRHGVGQMALAWFEGTARARRERNLWVAASDFNAGAIRFYERHGFIRAALLDGLVDDDKTEILLRKRLHIQK
jgi:GNAT superfamily N-acetyltransferase